MSDIEKTFKYIFLFRYDFNMEKCLFDELVEVMWDSPIRSILFYSRIPYLDINLLTSYGSINFLLSI